MEKFDFIKADVPGYLVSQPHKKIADCLKDLQLQQIDMQQDAEAAGLCLKFRDAQITPIKGDLFVAYCSVEEDVFSTLINPLMPMIMKAAADMTQAGPATCTHQDGFDENMRCNACGMQL